MQLRVAMKYCITCLFIEWGRGTEEICSMTVSCKEHKQSWDQAKGSHGSPSSWSHRLQSYLPWYFPSALMSSESLLCGCSWSTSPHGQRVHCAAGWRGNPARVFQVLARLFHCLLWLQIVVGSGTAAITAARSCAQPSVSASRKDACSGGCCEQDM